MIPDPAPPYEVNALGGVQDRIRRMYERAAELGVQAEIGQSIAAILQHLISDPREWGDPQWRYHALGMTYYGGTVGRFRCNYSVHDRIPTVVLINVFPLPGNPLCGENFDP